MAMVKDKTVLIGQAKRGRPKGSKNKTKSVKKVEVKENLVPCEVEEIISDDDRRDAPDDAYLTCGDFNPSGITPIEFKVLLREDEMSNVTPGGIIIPDESHDMDRRAQVRGTIVAMSPGAFSYHSWPAWVKLPKVGDRVLFAKYSGSKEKGKDGVEYRIVNDKDISATIDF